MELMSRHTMIHLLISVELNNIITLINDKKENKNVKLTTILGNNCLLYFIFTSLVKGPFFKFFFSKFKIGLVNKDRRNWHKKKEEFESRMPQNRKKKQTNIRNETKKHGKMPTGCMHNPFYVSTKSARE